VARSYFIAMIATQRKPTPKLDELIRVSEGSNAFKGIEYLRSAKRSGQLLPELRLVRSQQALTCMTLR
jgi:hypothetical protein